MDAGIQIGASPPKEHVDHVAAAITAILLAGRESRAEQQTIRDALGVLARTVKVENITIQNCTVTGDRNRAVQIDLPPDDDTPAIDLGR